MLIRSRISEPDAQLLLNWAYCMQPLAIVPAYNGYPYRLRMTNTGEYAWLTEPYRYEKSKTERPIHSLLVNMALAMDIRAETCIINYYKPGHGKLGLHQDRDEVSNAPILSVSLGCSARFIYSKTYTGEKTELKLEHRDVLVFGNEHRYMYHGVTEVLNDYPAIGARVNFTVRQVK